MRHIIGLCGYPTSGKDTFAKVLVDEFGFERVSFADPLRQMLLALNPFVDAKQRVSDLVERYGWDQSKKFIEVRRLLQRMGTEAGREVLGNDVWTNLAKKKIDSSQKSIVVTDVRFPNEVGLLKGMGATLYQIKRPNVGQVNKHASEQMDYGAVCDGVFENNGSQFSFEKTAREFGACLK